MRLRWKGQASGTASRDIAVRSRSAGFHIWELYFSATVAGEGTLFYVNVITLFNTNFY
jgi:hypothetical protein